MVRARLLVSTGLGLCLAGAGARAQGAEEARLAAIERQIQSLQSELARVRHDLATSRTELRQARQTRPIPVQPAPPPGQPATEANATTLPPASSVAPPQTQAAGAPNPGGVSFPAGRPTLTSNDGRYSLAVGLQLHYDVGGYFVGNSNPNAQPTRLNSFGENVRRARIPFVFKYDDFQINITPDFGGSPDGSPTLY